MQIHWLYNKERRSRVVGYFRAWHASHQERVEAWLP
jgi:hypothetical protein